MNIFDGILIIITLMGIAMAYQRGFILQAASVVGWIVSLVIAYRFSGDMAPYLQEIIPNPMSNQEDSGSIWAVLLDFDTWFYTIIAFLLLFFLTRLCISIIARVLNSISKLPILNFVNSILGAVLGFLQMVLISFFLIHLLFFLPWETGQIWVEESTIAYWFLGYSPFH